MRHILIPSISTLFFIYTLYTNHSNVSNNNKKDPLLIQKELKTKCENIIIDAFILMLKKHTMEFYFGWCLNKILAQINPARLYYTK